MELRKYKLGEIATIYNGSTPSTKESDNYDGDIIWATPKDLSDQQSKYFYCGSRNITEKGFHSCSTQMIPANNILMSSRAPIGLFAINKVDCCTNQGFKNIVLDKRIADVDFMYYFLKYHVKEIEALGSETTFKEVSKASFEKYEVSLPPLESQQKIAAVLSSLDDKIALNRRMNAKLEQMAKRLYDHWFVQFDFPNAGGKPYKSSGEKMEYNEVLKREIPAGWEVKRLGDVCEIFNGSTPLTADNDNYGGDIIWITPKDLSEQKSKFVYQGTRNITQKGYNSCSTTFVPKGTVVMSSRAPIGLLSIAMCELCTNQGFKNLVPKNKDYTNLLYYTLLNYIPQIQNLGTGTTFKEVSKEKLSNFSVLYPSDNFIKMFAEKTLSIFNYQLSIEKETQKLTALRDRLLPLLMNGQVEVR